MKIRIFVLVGLWMMLLAVGMNTRNIAANNNKIEVIQSSDTRMIANAMKSVVMVVHPNFPIPATGFYIGDGIIVTAGHVAKIEGIEKVIFENGHEYNVIKQIACPDYDCGFLIVGDVNEPAMKPDDDYIVRGDVLYILGNPAGYTFVVSKGIMSGYDDCNGYFGSIDLLVYDFECINGNSGSPVIDDEGEFVAVHVGSNGTGYSVGVSKEYIYAALAVLIDNDAGPKRDNTISPADGD